MCVQQSSATLHVSHVGASTRQRLFRWPLSQPQTCLTAWCQARFSQPLVRSFATSSSLHGLTALLGDLTNAAGLPSWVRHPSRGRIVTSNHTPAACDTADCAVSSRPLPLHRGALSSASQPPRSRLPTASQSPLNRLSTASQPPFNHFSTASQPPRSRRAAH